MDLADMGLAAGCPTDTHCPPALWEVGRAYCVSCQSFRAGTFLTWSRRIPRFGLEALQVQQRHRPWPRDGRRTLTALPQRGKSAGPTAFLPFFALGRFSTLGRRGEYHSLPSRCHCVLRALAIAKALAEQLHCSNCYRRCNMDSEDLLGTGQWPEVPM